MTREQYYECLKTNLVGSYPGKSKTWILEPLSAGEQRQGNNQRKCGSAQNPTNDTFLTHSCVERRETHKNDKKKKKLE